MRATSTARLFVAVEIPERVRFALAGWARSASSALASRAGPGPSPRLLKAELMHVTLCFLGDTPLGAIEPIRAALQALEPEPLSALSLGAPVWLPPRRPRALAVEIHDDGGGLATLRGDVVHALAGACGFRPERRRYRPHVTVARLGRGWGDLGAEEELRLTATPSVAFVPQALVLHRSLLAPAGASYEALATRALP